MVEIGRTCAVKVLQGESPSNRRVNPRTIFLLKTKLFHTFVRRLHHPECEIKLFLLHNRDLKKLSFRPIAIGQKLNDRKVNFFYLNRPSLETRDSQHETFSYTKHVRTIQIDFSRSYANRITAYTPTSTRWHSLSFHFYNFTTRYSESHELGDSEYH